MGGVSLRHDYGCRAREALSPLGLELELVVVLSKDGHKQQRTKIGHCSVDRRQAGEPSSGRAAVGRHCCLLQRGSGGVEISPMKRPHATPTKLVARRCSPSPHSWSHCVRRGEVYRFRTPESVGNEQQGVRYGVVVQADELLPRSVVIIAPTSRSARSASFRPEVIVAGDTTRTRRTAWRGRLSTTW